MTVVIVGLISTLTISFAGSMVTQLQVARDQAAAVHAELSAQSGLEYAERQLLLDPLWKGTDGDPLLFTVGSAFQVDRLIGKGSKIMPSEVKLEVAGMQSAARSKFMVHLRVDPGDPLLDKALSVLGDTSGQNLRIDGDFLILDAPGWLWSFRQDLVDAVQTEENAAPSDSLASDGRFGQQLALDHRDAVAQGKEKALGFDNEGSPDNKRLKKLSNADQKRVEKEYKTWLKDVKKRLALSATNTTENLLLHVRKDKQSVEGVWARTDAGKNSTISLSRVDALGEFHNFSEQLFQWAVKQKQVGIPIHAPGWDLDSYMVPQANVQIFDHETDIHDISLDKTAVFLLDPDQELHLENVEFNAGMVVWCEKDFDFSGPPRNQVFLAGDNTVGGVGMSPTNEALIAPGCAFTVIGTGRHSLTGFSLIHSLSQVRRFHHAGVLIVLNSADQVLDSEFTYTRNIAVSPPQGLHFFGNLPSVKVELQLESFDTPIPL